MAAEEQVFSRMHGLAVWLAAEESRRAAERSVQFEVSNSVVQTPPAKLIKLTNDKFDIRNYQMSINQNNFASSNEADSSFMGHPFKLLNQLRWQNLLLLRKIAEWKLGLDRSEKERRKESEKQTTPGKQSDTWGGR